MTDKINMANKNKQRISLADKKSILAIDLGTKTGWALSKEGEITSGSVSFEVTKFNGTGLRFISFRNWLFDMVKKHNVDVVVFEMVYRHLGTFAAHVYGGFLSQLQVVCEELNIPYQGYGVKEIKKHMTGNGNATKDDMIRATEALGFRPIDDNEADGIAILKLALSGKYSNHEYGIDKYSSLNAKRYNNYLASKGIGRSSKKYQKQVCDTYSLNTHGSL